MSALDEYYLQYSAYSPVNEDDLSDEEREDLEIKEWENSYQSKKED